MQLQWFVCWRLCANKTLLLLFLKDKTKHEKRTDGTKGEKEEKEESFLYL